MASTVLPNGIIIPEKYSRDWYNDLYHNWQELDNLLAGGGANDGTLTIQKNGTTVGTFSANQATDETINIEVPDVNDATLTIQQNGTTVDTFTANSSSDKTVNIQCVDLTNNQTVGGDKEFTGTTTAHDLVPSATETYNFGSSSYQWNNAYIKSLTINGVACGDILTHNVSEFVNLSSNQTIGGIKTFSSNVIIQGSKKVTCNLDNSFIELDGGTTWGKGGSIVLSGQDRSSYTNSVLIVSKSDTNTDILQYQNGELKPLSNNTNNSSLGTSTNKWKSFNGINPGALSLPAVDYTTLDTTNFVLDGTTNNRLIVPYDCWLNIRMTSCESYAIKNAMNGISYYVTNASGDMHLTIPVPKDTNMSIITKCSTIELRAYKCLGNI